MRVPFQKAAFSALSAAAVVLAASGGSAWAQTQVFLDNFDRATLNTGAPTTYTSAGTGDGGASLVTGFTGAGAGNVLQITNDATATGNTAGQYYVSGLTSSFGAPYNSILNQNTGLIEWTINGKQIRPDPAGFGGGSYGWAVSLASSNSNLLAGSGYGIIFGNSGSVDSPRLVKFASGLGSATNVIGPNTTDLPADSTSFFSVRVTYDPTGNQWSLYVRDDGSTLNPSSSGITTQIGATTQDSDYTGTALTNFGYAWSYSTGATQTAQFDNFRVSVTDTPEPGTLALFALGAGPATGLIALRRRAGRPKKA